MSDHGHGRDDVRGRGHDDDRGRDYGNFRDDDRDCSHGNDRDHDRDYDYVPRAYQKLLQLARFKNALEHALNFVTQLLAIPLSQDLTRVPF